MYWTESVGLVSKRRIVGASLVPTLISLVGRGEPFGGRHLG